MKRQRLSEWIEKKKRPNYMLSTLKKPALNIDTYRLRVNGWRKFYYANTNQKSWCSYINFRLESKGTLPGTKKSIP